MASSMLVKPRELWHHLRRRESTHANEDERNKTDLSDASAASTDVASPDVDDATDARNAEVLESDKSDVDETNQPDDVHANDVESDTVSARTDLSEETDETFEFDSTEFGSTEFDSTSIDERRFSPGRHRLRNTAITCALLAPFVFSLIAWQIDTNAHHNRVARKVTVLGQHMGGVRYDEVSRRLSPLAPKLAQSSIDVRANNHFHVIVPNDIGIQLDMDATSEKLKAFEHNESAITRYVLWLRGLVAQREVVPVYTMSNDALNRVAKEIDPKHRAEPTEPSLAWHDDHLVIKQGKNGHGVSGEMLHRAISQQGSTLPMRIAVLPKAISPRVSTLAAQAFLREVEVATESVLATKAGSQIQSVNASQLRSTLGSTADDDRLQLTFDANAMNIMLERVHEKSGVQPTEAAFVVENEVPRAEDGKAGNICCDKAAGQLVFEAIAQRMRGSASTSTGTNEAPIELPLRDVPAKSLASSLDSLQIKEVVGEFTTRHAPNQPRVKNIHRIADLVRGDVIKPGETYSLNRAVGPRTPEKGFVVDHVIVDGKFSDSVGGGISQFATTTFNAAFFAGLDFGEYQSHSIYIDRYPYGREATISFPHPDLQIRNNTPNGVLIWPSYTATSITVKLYSTRYATGEQTAQSEQPYKNCKRVTTERKRTFVDGRTVTDKVYALYQPAEGEKCQ